MSEDEKSQGAKSSKLLDQMRDLMRVRRYALRTERAYCDWVRRYVTFHGMKSREDLADGGPKVERFLTHLAVQGNVAPSTQNQALNAAKLLATDHKRVDRLSCWSKFVEPAKAAQEQLEVNLGDAGIVGYSEGRAGSPSRPDAAATRPYQ